MPDRERASAQNERGSFLTACGETFYCSANNGIYCPNGKTYMGDKCV